MKTKRLINYVVVLRFIFNHKNKLFYNLQKLKIVKIQHKVIDL
jgi:hypothetical protein